MITDRFAGNLSKAILNQDDPATVRDGAPAYLLLLDSFVIDAPDNPSVLKASATLYGTYATIFVDDAQRAKRLSQKARNQGRKAICGDYPEVCSAERKPITDFEKYLASIDPDDIDLLFAYGTTWAIWIQTHRDDWNAVADLARVEAVMKRVLEINEHHEWGRAHLYLGVINSQLPPSLGGKPDVGKAHFERALEISSRKDLMAQLEYARNYARLVFDKELHNTLLKEIIAADNSTDGLILSNTLAKEQAESLLETSEEYFEE